jgi:large subunit ribosomal protein L34e
MTRLEDMTNAKYKSRSWKRKSVRRGGEIKIMYKRSRIVKSRCICGRPLPGVKSTGNSITEKRVTRPFGGSLCAKCMRRMIIQDVRGAQ